MNADAPAILYLDDEEHNLGAFRATFRRHFRIFTATSAREAVQMLRGQDIPIVITDQRMPDMTGVQFLEAIIPEFPDTIRMILTGFSDIEAVIKAINSGRVYRYIAKPWDEQEMLMTLQGAAELTRLARRNRELVTELQQKVEDQERIVKLFQKYVPEHIVAEALRRRDDRILDGEARVVSVLISDIRDFTAIAAHMDPRDVVALLNGYFGMMTACVKRHNGTVNKFLGDGMLAIFGAPVSYLENQDNAVLAALEMVENLGEFNRVHGAGLGTPLRIGIGINTGEVVVGNMGSEERVEYTVIGDTVNVASRIESLTRGHPDAIFISRSTYDAVHGLVEAEDLGTVEIRGREEQVQMFRVLGRK